MILLVGVNAKYIHSNLGVYCIDAYAKAHGISEDNLKVAEYTINQNESDVIAGIYEQKPDMIAFSCYIWNIEFVVRVSRELKKILPDTDIWYGGPEVTFDAVRQIEKYPFIKGVMIGEGEKTFYELAHTYLSGDKKISDIKGIAYRQDGEIILGEERPRMNMDEVVFPYHDMKKFENRIIYYETSRGCPYGCSYCLSSVEKSVRFRSMDKVEKELQFFLDAKVPQVKFVDRTFNCNHEHTMQIWKYLYEHDNGITNFHFEMSADLLSKEEMEYVKKFRKGLVQFEIGVQSSNEDTLRAIRRNHDLTCLKNNVSVVYEERNIHQHLDLIAGLPYEDYETFKKSFNDVYAMKPDQLQLGFLKVLKGSPIYYDKEKFGIVHQDIPPYEVLFTKWLGYDEVLLLKMVEDMVERYYNSMQFEASVRFMVSKFDTPFDFFQTLGLYYHDKGYEGIHQSRMQNYEILMEFAENNTTQVLEENDLYILRQLLAFDLYARENLKNRPQFIHQENADKTKIREFYQSEEKREQYFSNYREYDWKQVMRMTHMEMFDYDILGYLHTGHLVQKNTMLFFDYKERNPLDHQAKITAVKSEV